MAGCMILPTERLRRWYPSQVRLAHFSDLHLLSLDGARLFDFANKRWIGRLNLLSNRSRHYLGVAFDDMIEDLNKIGVDHAVCTGDVTNLAFAQEFRFARERFERLALGPENVTVIPGNHDAYVEEGVSHFNSIFGAYHASDPGWAWSAADRDGPRDDLRWPAVRVRGELALIAASTSLETPWFSAWGRLGAGQRARLRKALADPRLAGKARVLAIHHPVTGKRATNAIRGLRDHAELAAIIADTGAAVVIHGHEHRDLRGALRGPSGEVPVLGVPSGTYAAADPTRTARYRIFDLEGGRVVSHHLRVWRRESHSFEDDPAEPALAA
jgi:3',5'-cyclic AMP phosphodiesterase CpdA